MPMPKVLFSSVTSECKKTFGGEQKKREKDPL